VRAKGFLVGVPLALALLSPMQARADLTAVYQRPKARAALTIEVAEDGSTRITDSPDRYELWSGGEAYSVVAGPGGPLVFRLSDIQAARAHEKPPFSISEPWVALGHETVDGRVGTKYKIQGAETNPDASTIVVSDDPALSQLGDAIRRYEAAEAMMSPPDNSAEQTSRLSILSNGTPIVYYDQRLISLSSAPIPPERFKVPATPKTPSETRDYWAQDQSPPEHQEDEGKRFTERAIKRAMFADERLWLLNDGGGLSSVRPGDRKRQEERAPGAVVDMCTVENVPRLLTEDGSLLRLWRGGSSGWQELARLPKAKGDEVLGLACSPTRSIVLTRKRVLLLEGAAQRSISVAGHIGGPAVVSNLLDVGSALYVWLNAGEWGGGLSRIELSDGRVSKPSVKGKDLCSGPLNVACDPVNGVARKPGDPSCLIVAVGLVHFFPHGRLTEVCGSKIRRYFYKPYTLETTWPLDPPTEPSSTVPFFGLTEADGKLWAVGSDGLYEIVPNEQPKFHRMPEFYDAGGIAVSFDMPGLVLIRTSINQRVSVSGAVSLVVSR
jgi:hypothetical protein